MGTSWRQRKLSTVELTKKGNEDMQGHTRKGTLRPQRPVARLGERRVETRDGSGGRGNGNGDVDGGGRKGGEKGA
jgi:hypothetical protein